MKRKIYNLMSGARQGLFVLALFVSGTALSQVSYSFAYTGAVQTLTLSAGAWGIQSWGANGGDAGAGAGGVGAYSFGAFNVAVAGTQINILVGGKGTNGGAAMGSGGAGGWNGGGGGGACGKTGGGGGGGTDVRVGGIAATNRIIVAGGGGGASFYDQGAAGGNGGGQTAGNGNFITMGNVLTIGGGGAGAVGGTPGASNPFWASSDGTATGGGGGGNSPGLAGVGQQGTGGGAGGAGAILGGGLTGGSGGGGGGYAGGAGGSQTVNAGIGGGGGSGFVTGLINGITVSTGQPGFVSNPDITGNGYLIITAICGITLSAMGGNPICAGNSATLITNAASNYAWSNGGNFSSTVVSPTITTSYTLTATSFSNCTSSAVITVSVDNTPTVTAVISPSVVCVNQPVIMTAFGASSYTWTGGITNGGVYTPTTNGSYTYAVSGTNACGNSTAAVVLTVNPLPNITASINNPTVCSGSSIILNGGGSVSGYTWSAGAPNNTAIVPPTTTSYVVTGAGSNGCTNTAAVGVTVLITPNIPPVVTPTAICFGSTATLSATGATGFTWTPGSNPNTATIVVSPPVSTTYTLVRTNGPCSSSRTVNLVVFPLPLVNASATPTQICAGTGANLVVSGPTTNTWLPGGFTMANFTIYPNVSTNYTVTGSNGNCTATAIVTVVVNPSPTITISSSTNIICQGNNVTLTGNGGLSYTWQPMNTSNTTQIVSPSTTTIITLSGSNSFGCTSSVSQLIQVFPLPNTNLTGSSSFICVGQTAAISITSPASNVVYNWNTGTGGTSISASPSVTTNYFVTATNTITGCVNTSTFVLSVYIATFVVTSPTAICNGQTTTLTATGPASSYVWTGNGGIPIASGVSSVTISPLVTTNYSVTGTTGNCSNQQAFSVIVHPLPNVTVQTAKKQICRLEVSIIIGSGATSYSWNTGATTPTITVAPAATTTYTLTGTDVNGCSKTTTVTQFVATCIGLEDFETDSADGIMVYPNPNNGNFTIRSSEKISVSIINALGQVISTVTLDDNNGNEVTVNSLPTGVYFITGQKNGVALKAKIIVER